MAGDHEQRVVDAHAQPDQRGLEAGARLAAEQQAGAEKAAALVTSVFLHGTERRTQGRTGQPRVTGPVSD